MKKNNLKKFAFILGIISMLFSMAMPAFALETTPADRVGNITSATQATDIIDTTAMTQTEYVADLQELTATVSTDLALQRTCELFISSIYASRRDDDYDCTAFATQANRTETLNNTLAYIESQNAYQREISEL